jgi:hypothetical protein
MLQVRDGQCGLCAHFGEIHKDHQSSLLDIRVKREAPETLLDDCGHPKHAPLHLKVSPISGCDGFEVAKTSTRH